MVARAAPPTQSARYVITVITELLHQMRTTNVHAAQATTRTPVASARRVLLPNPAKLANCHRAPWCVRHAAARTIENSRAAPASAKRDTKRVPLIQGPPVSRSEKYDPVKIPIELLPKNLSFSFRYQTVKCLNRRRSLSCYLSIICIQI